MNSTDFPKTLQVGDYVLLALPVLCATTLLRLPLASPKHGRRENAKPSRDNKGKEKTRIRLLCRCPKYQQEMIFQHIGCSVFPFLAIFGNLARKKKTESEESTNGFFGKNWAQVAILRGNKILAPLI
jgi:hypothetical protein